MMRDVTSWNSDKTAAPRFVNLSLVCGHVEQRYQTRTGTAAKIPRRVVCRSCRSKETPSLAATAFKGNWIAETLKRHRDKGPLPVATHPPTMYHDIRKQK